MTKFTSLCVSLLAAFVFAAFASPALAQRAAPRGGSVGAGRATRDPQPDPPPIDPFARKAQATRAKETAQGDPTGGFASPALQAGSGETDVLRLKDGRTFELEEARLSGSAGVTGTVAGTGEATRFATSEVETLEIAVSPDFRRGLELYDAGRLTATDADLRQALALFQTARKNASRRLEKEWATAKIAETLQRLGRTDEAASEFFLLCRLDPLTPYLPSIPLRWTMDASRGEAYDPSAASRTEALAREWIKPHGTPTGQANPTARLLAASILLESQSGRREAQEALRALATFASSDESNLDETESARRISLLAIAQLWRLDALAGPTEALVDRWVKTAALFPAGLRDDPSGFVALMELKLGRDEALGRVVRASASVADRDLARACGTAALDACARLGRRDEERELRRRFGGAGKRNAIL